MMTRKDFEIVAEEMRRNRPGEFSQSPDYHAGYMQAAKAVGFALVRINPRFDHSRFMQAVLKEVTPCSID